MDIFKKIFKEMDSIFKSKNIDIDYFDDDVLYELGIMMIEGGDIKPIARYDIDYEEVVRAKIENRLRNIENKCSIRIPNKETYRYSEPIYKFDCDYDSDRFDEEGIHFVKTNDNSIPGCDSIYLDITRNQVLIDDEDQ